MKELSSTDPHINQEKKKDARCRDFVAPILINVCVESWVYHDRWRRACCRYWIQAAQQTEKDTAATSGSWYLSSWGLWKPVLPNKRPHKTRHKTDCVQHCWHLLLWLWVWVCLSVRFYFIFIRLFLLSGSMKRTLTKMTSRRRMSPTCRDGRWEDDT